MIKGRIYFCPYFFIDFLAKNGKISNMEDGQKNKNEAWWQPAFMMFARLSGWVIAPVIIGALVGQWLDARYKSEPWLFLASVGIAFVLSMFGLIKNTMDEYKRINSEFKEKEEKNKE